MIERPDTYTCHWRSGSWSQFFLGQVVDPRPSVNVAISALLKLKNMDDTDLSLLYCQTCRENAIPRRNGHRTIDPASDTRWSLWSNTSRSIFSSHKVRSQELGYVTARARQSIAGCDATSLGAARHWILARFGTQLSRNGECTTHGPAIHHSRQNL